MPAKAYTPGDRLGIRLADAKRDLPAYNDDTITAELLELIGYNGSRQHNSRAAFCELLSADVTTVQRVYQGKYPSIGAFMRKHARPALARVRALPGTGFVETLVTRKVHAALDMARELGGMVLVCGRAGRGKSEAVKEWQLRNNHGKAIYLDVPAIGGVRALLQELALRAGLSIRSTSADLARAIERQFDSTNVLILDEAVRLMPTTVSRTSITRLDFLRRLHDVYGVGIVLVSTPVLPAEMRRPEVAAYMAQLDRRIDEPLMIPDKVGAREARQVCAAFAAPAEPPDHLVELACKTANGRGSIGLLFKLLRQASMLAKKQNAPLAAVHLGAALNFRAGLHRWPDAD